MPSSITTVVPSGTIINWCVADQIQYGDTDPYQCANKTIHQSPSDFESICCDGTIINTSYDLWRPSRENKLNIDDLVCCRYHYEEGGLHAINPTKTICTAGTPTPLASLAATNVDNARAYLVTYASASQDGTSLGDWTLLTTPQCLWMNTNTKDSQGVPVKTVVVPAADITTLGPDITSEYGVFNPPIPQSSFDGGETTETGTSTMGVGSDGSSPVITTGPSGTGALTTGGAATATKTPNSSANISPKRIIILSMCILSLGALL
ncbi:hypothetical protein TWF694_006261 [Orbilia ellipsospora]|uniref:Uncharacterized protein n=1 Tax=Orbilia ellipsospora TaxID=2528407 RepID=A0AAV9XL88_9PEZI